jgi:hypothetical protein
MKTNLLMLLALAAPACTTQDPYDFAVDNESTAKADGALWYKIYSCDGGAGVLDLNANERRNLQFVIRDPNIIKFFNDTGVVHSSYGATELVLSGWTGYVDWGHTHGPVLHYQPYGGPGVFYPWDFQELIANTDYYNPNPFIRVFRDGDGIKVQAGHIDIVGCARTETYCPGDGYPCQDSCVDNYTQFTETANWYFASCAQQ